MDPQFDKLIEQLIASIDTFSGEGVNQKRCEIEAEIVGYLLGRKVAMHDGAYVPPEINQYHDLPLQSLNRVASRAWEAFKKEKRM